MDETGENTGVPKNVSSQEVATPQGHNPIDEINERLYQSATENDKLGPPYESIDQERRSEALERFAEELQSEYKKQLELTPELPLEEFYDLMHPLSPLPISEYGNDRQVTTLLKTFGALSEEETLTALRADGKWNEVREGPAEKPIIRRTHEPIPTNIGDVSLVVRENRFPQANPQLGQLKDRTETTSVILGPNALRQVATQPITKNLFRARAQQQAQKVAP